MDSSFRFRKGISRSTRRWPARWAGSGATTARFPTQSVGDDVKPGKHTSFPQAVKLKKGEVVWLSWATYKNRAHRDRVNKNAMKDGRVAKIMASKDMPFDMKRIFFGGFKVVVDL